ncbi:hypothetical protein GTW51_20240 [Aurantimonas aggregata]|uniref:Uncharacterized protein n=1 Tax=Aurantimonas aggregata TaxID=2047720 RepID=A0A6L9MND5_9HYPH|nr:hypothetical protein [Aurantimonas aggregata]NDV89010.1 hypothetical protein [Aurantimonas aggregata]
MPVAEGGELSHFIHRRLCKKVATPPDAAVCGFVAGLELLGYRLSVAEDAQGSARITIAEPREPIPPSWTEFAYRLMAAMPIERDDEVVSFLAVRNLMFRKREIVKALVEWVDHGSGGNDEAVTFVRASVPDATGQEVEATTHWMADTLAGDRRGPSHQPREGYHHAA